MKKIISTLLVLGTVLSSSAAFAEGEEITVLINNEKLVTDVAPQLVNDRTMLPLRAIFEALDAQVTWIGEDQLIFATKDEYLITLQIGNYKMSVQTILSDENKAVELDAAPYIYNDRTLVPVRAIAEALNADVEWLGETKTVVITTEENKEAAVEAVLE